MHRQAGFCEGIRDRFASLAGQRIVAASCIEMAFGGDRGQPLFQHPGLPFVQVMVLELVLSDGGSLHVATWMDEDARCGLLLRPAAPGDALQPGAHDAPDSIYRHRRLTECPAGMVVDVGPTLTDRGVVSEVRLGFGGAGLHLVAGEVYEDGDGRFTVRKDDESVLIVFGDEARARIRFGVPV